ncbi:MAG: bifunctional phosphopantothenoylcysteine decarboxylase/phosphopantothenate--cysteine ligase CoaBC [Bdellovibrionota bacterium]
MNILLGVSGSIAAYKACELVRGFQKQGQTVQVIMSPNAEKFVSALTFESLTQRKVATHTFGKKSFATEHIDLARWADLFLIAPASANLLADLAHGKADHLITTVALAYSGPLWLSPAMNTFMWNHPAVQANLQTLISRGVQVIDPREGELACGEIGQGAMADVDLIISRTLQSRCTGPLSGKKVVDTAGPTREYLDAVRFFSNPSTGTMGLMLAEKAHERGADVTLVHGPVSVSIPAHLRSISVVSAQQMFDAVATLVPCDVYISTAAVADFRFEQSFEQKQSKNNIPASLPLIKNPDIISYVSQHKRASDLVVGFAAQSHDIETYAKEKMQRKNLDLIVANQVYQEKSGFGDVSNDFLILSPDQDPTWLRNHSKKQTASVVLDRIESMMESTA